MTTPTADNVTLGDPNVETTNFARYKGTKNNSDRIAIIGSKLLRGYNYFFEGHNKKKLFIAPEAGKTLDFLKEQMGEPQQRFVLTLFHYRTDSDGLLVDDTKCQGKVKVWSVSEARYEELSALNSSWALMDGGFDAKQFDLICKCTDEKWQRMNFTPAPDAHWKSKQAWYDALKAKTELAKKAAADALGQKMSDEEIRAMLGGTSAPEGSTASADDIDLSDVLGD